MPISKNLTVVKNFNGTDHWPAGSLLSVDLTCIDDGVDKAARLSVVLVNLVNGTVQEVPAFAAGVIAVTKITSGCTGQSAYVKENFYDVYAAQNPCCGAAPAGNITPAPPTLTADDAQGQDWLAASHALGSSEILVSVNGGAFVAYTGAISVGNVARASGYYAFKVKAAPGRNESAVALSPAFTVASQQLATPTISFENVTDTSFDVVIGGVANATQYEVEVAGSNSFGAPISTGTVNSTTNPLKFTFVSGQPTTAYWARVRATAPGYTPSNWITAQTVTLFDTVLTFVASTSGAAENAKFGIGGTVADVNNQQKFYFNKITGTLTGTPSSMTIDVGGTTEMVIDYPTDYNGRAFRYHDVTGASHIGTFTNGTVNF
jgi:hypothetical protein